MLNGTLIRQAREERGLSQARLAEALGVVELTVWRWENKPTKSLDYQTVRGLVDSLGVDESALFVSERHDADPLTSDQSTPLTDPTPDFIPSGSSRVDGVKAGAR